MHPTLSFLPMPAAPTPKVLKAFRKDAGWSETGDAALNGAFAPGSRVQWAAVLSGKKKIGIVRLELAPPQFCYLSELVILGEYRGRGVGEWFMEQIEQFCLARGIDRVVLQATGDSRGFYDKLRYQADPLAAGFLKKDIKPLLRKPAFPFARSTPGVRPG
ncbi:GNAT family N-acetyltransferase [Massilia phosphatilytica]|nr:GNAT family N-acetyltransferase [Massilia phosphatilytica]